MAFKDTLALELGYKALGVVNDGDTLYRYRSEFVSTSLSAISIHQFNTQISAYGRLGITRLEVDWRATDASGQVNRSSIGEYRPVFGIGGRYSVDEHLAARIEYSYIRWEEFNFSGLSAGVEYSF